MLMCRSPFQGLLFIYTSQSQPPRCHPDSGVARTLGGSRELWVIEQGQGRASLQSKGHGVRGVERGYSVTQQLKKPWHRAQHKSMSQIAVFVHGFFNCLCSNRPVCAHLSLRNKLLRLKKKIVHMEFIQFHVKSNTGMDADLEVIATQFTSVQQILRQCVLNCVVIML